MFLLLYPLSIIEDMQQYPPQSFSIFTKDENIEYRGNIDGPKIGNFDGNIEEILISVNVGEK